jgi:hypothetical protein
VTSIRTQVTYLLGCVDTFFRLLETLHGLLGHPLVLVVELLQRPRRCEDFDLPLMSGDERLQAIRQE